MNWLFSIFRRAPRAKPATVPNQWAADLRAAWRTEYARYEPTWSYAPKRRVAEPVAEPIADVFGEVLDMLNASFGERQLKLKRILRAQFPELRAA